MKAKRGRYSFLIRPFVIFFDSLVIFLFCFSFFKELNEHNFDFLYVLFGWYLVSYVFKFYQVYRYTKALEILSLLIKQLFGFILILYSFFGFTKTTKIESKQAFLLIFSIMGIVGCFKFFTYWALKKFRSSLGGNNRNVVIFGGSAQSNEIRSFFVRRKDLGYAILATFSKELITDIEQVFRFLDSSGVDEIYCDLDELSDEVVNRTVSYTDRNAIVLKFIPSKQMILTKRLKTDYYGYLPVLSIPEVALNNNFNDLIKRAFDVGFSLFVIVFVLPWIIPVFYILIKLESKGPIFYKHIRNGINYKEFACYKFRTLNIGSDIETKHVRKNDDRVTKIGRFLRRTSLDELPQFYNVLIGEMSIVGPRPHMVPYTHLYAKKIDKYNFLFRHVVKPGITGLAQVKGYRGEVRINEDIINRIKYDIFYIENWTVLLDLKIIVLTIFKVFKGDENAY